MARCRVRCWRRCLELAKVVTSLGGAACAGSDVSCCLTFFFPHDGMGEKWDWDLDLAKVTQ